MLAIRLLTAGAIVFLGPGLAVLRGRSLGWPERIALAFALSYGWTFVLSVLLPLATLTVDAAAVLSLAVIGIALFKGGLPRLPSRPQFRVPAAEVVLFVAVVAIAGSTWRIESTLSGEEALDLASSARFADGRRATFTDMSLMPRTQPVYLFQPYQLAVGMIARCTRSDPLITLIKLRPLFVFLSLIAVYALLRQLLPRPEQAVAAMGVVIVFIALDANTWEAASLLPYARRGGFTEGVCVPAFLTLVLIGSARVVDDAQRRVRTLAGIGACLLVLAAMATHPLEIAPALFFVAAVVGTVCLGLDSTRDRRHAAVLVMCLVMAVVVYLQLHRYAVPEVRAFEDASKQAARTELVRLGSTPLALIAGPMDRRGRNLIANDLPNSTAGALGIPALMLAAMVAPTAAVLLFLAIVPFLLLHASPGAFLALSIVTSPATPGSWSGYPALIGLLALAIGLEIVGRSVVSLSSWIRPGIARVTATVVLIVGVAGAFWAWVPMPTAWLLKFAANQPRPFVLMAAVLGIPVVAIARYSPGGSAPSVRFRVRMCAVLTVAITAAVTVAYYRSSARPAVVGVRWAETVDRNARATLEKRFALTDGDDTSDATVRTYRLTDTSNANVRGLVENPAVKDTQHIDRQTFAVEQTAPTYQLSQAVQLAGAAIAALWFIGFLLPAGWSMRAVAAVPFPVAVTLTTALIALPLPGLGKREPERISLLGRFREAHHEPSVVDWPGYYDVIRTTMNNQTPIRVPASVVDALKVRLSPRTVLLSNPDYSCALAALLDAYCVNPADIYGHYFLSAGPYLAHYRQVGADGHAWHPFFNSTWPVDERERSMLKDYEVRYLLADPEHAEMIQRKLDALQVAATVEFRGGGYVLYHF